MTRWDRRQIVNGRRSKSESRSPERLYARTEVSVVKAAIAMQIIHRRLRFRGSIDIENGESAGATTVRGFTGGDVR
jgi:hypothetical protein